VVLRHSPLPCKMSVIGSIETHHSRHTQNHALSNFQKLSTVNTQNSMLDGFWARMDLHSPSSSCKTSVADPHESTTGESAGGILISAEDGGDASAVEEPVVALSQKQFRKTIFGVAPLWTYDRPDKSVATLMLFDENVQNEKVNLDSALSNRNAVQLRTVPVDRVVAKKLRMKDGMKGTVFRFSYQGEPAFQIEMTESAGKINALTMYQSDYSSISYQAGDCPASSFLHFQNCADVLADLRDVKRQIKASATAYLPTRQFTVNQAFLDLSLSNENARPVYENAFRLFQEFAQHLTSRTVENLRFYSEFELDRVPQARTYLRAQMDWLDGVF
jgi:hypothetical protein